MKKHETLCCACAVLTNALSPYGNGHTGLVGWLQEVPQIMTGSFSVWESATFKTQRPLSSRLALELLLTFPCTGHVMASRSLWSIITDATACSTDCVRELHFLSPVPRSITHTHKNPHWSVSSLQAEKNASWNVKYEYKRASHDSDHWIMGNKARRQICNSSHYPLLSQMWFF